MHYQTLELFRFLCIEIVKLDYFKAMAILSEPFFTAARVGIHQVVEELFVACPDMIYSQDGEGRTALGIVVMNRDIDIYNLTSRMRYDCRQFLSTQMDHGNNTLLHLVGALPPKHKLNHISGGAAIQMKNELMWYKVTCYSLLAIFLSQD